tara:strand:+ start:776 stop:955 length:180 start_codon:yes stop_codon:yes gene_type:complete
MKRDKWYTIKIGDIYEYEERTGKSLVVIVDHGNDPHWIGVKFVACGKYRQIQKAHLEVA